MCTMLRIIELFLLSLSQIANWVYRWSYLHRKWGDMAIIRYNTRCLCNNPDVPGEDLQLNYIGEFFFNQLHKNES